jgi:YgiT-type zinc finger domain-containing protein
MKASLSTRRARSVGSKGKTTSTFSSRRSARSTTEFLLSRCPECRKSGIRTEAVDRVYEVHGVRRVARNVLVQACPHCGASFLGPKAMTQVDKALRLGQRRARKPAA